MVAQVASLNINVKTNDVDRAQNKLGRLTTQGKRTEAQVIKLQDRFKNFGTNASAAVSAVDGPLGGVSSRISALTTVATRGGVAVTALAVAVTGLTFVLQRGVRQLDEYNVDLAKTEALLKATGFAAGVTAKQLEEEAQAIAFNTLASVRGIQEAQGILLTFDRIQGDVRENAVGLAQDLSTVFGGTAASQATQLGKALQDPLKGITALNRVGVSFNDTQREQIKLFQESGDIVSAQTVIIEALKSQVGGAGEAVAKDSLAGKLDTAGQLFANFAAGLARSTGIYDATLSFFDSLNGALTGLNEGLQGDGLSQITEQVEDQIAKISALEKKLSGERNYRRQQRVRAQIQSAQKELEVLKAKEANLSAIEQVEIEKREVALAASEEKKQEIRNEAIQKEIAADKERLEKLLEQQESARNREQLRDEERSAFIREENKRIADETAQAYDDLAGALSTSTSQLADAVGEFAGEQSTAYKAAFALSKGFATAQASLNFALALSQALADPSALTLPQKLANYSAVATAGGALLSTLGGINYNGGRLQGGSVGSNDAVMVGERGPELFVPGNSGRVINNNQLSGESSGDMNVTIVNQTTGRIDNVQTQQLTRNDVAIIIQETVPLEIANPNSRTSKALKNSTNSQRRLS